MHNLKKALTREDPKKYHKTKIQVSGVKHSHQCGDIEWLLMKKSEKRPIEIKIEENFKKIIENNFSNGEIKDIVKLHKDLLEKYTEFFPNEASSASFDNILSLLKNMNKSEEGFIFKKYIELTCQKLSSFVKDKESKEKAKCLDEFNKLLKKVKPTQQLKEEFSSMNKALKKLVHSTSAANLKIRVTRDEYQLEEEQNPLKRKKSLEFKNKSKVSSQSHKNLSGSNKLQMFLKDTNVKLVKTKIQYDFSAIFEASKSNIQPRNKTTFIQPRSEKELLTKATKGKRDEAFVFYRPQKKR